MLIDLVQGQSAQHSTLKDTRFAASNVEPLYISLQVFDLFQQEALRKQVWS